MKSKSKKPLLTRREIESDLSIGDDGMAGETAALDFGMSLEESEALLIPGGEAGKCSQCGNDSSVYGCFLKDAKRSICRSTACKQCHGTLPGHESTKWYPCCCHPPAPGQEVSKIT
jgi:hypothetical protein